VQDVVLRTEFQGKVSEWTMMHQWPVRQPRPCAKKLPGDYPLLTGA
jgi:vacuolar-type H+-ATPase catalytic subunit A/Vma1